MKNKYLWMLIIMIIILGFVAVYFVNTSNTLIFGNTKKVLYGIPLYPSLQWKESAENIYTYPYNIPSQKLIVKSFETEYITPRNLEKFDIAFFQFYENELLKLNFKADDKSPDGTPYARATDHNGSSTYYRRETDNKHVIIQNKIIFDWDRAAQGLPPKVPIKVKFEIFIEE